MTAQGDSDGIGYDHGSPESRKARNAAHRRVSLCLEDLIMGNDDDFDHPGNQPADHDVEQGTVKRTNQNNSYGHHSHAAESLNASMAIGLQLNLAASPTANQSSVSAEDHVPDYNDYLRGQRVMKLTRRISVPNLHGSSIPMSLKEEALSPEQPIEDSSRGDSLHFSTVGRGETDPDSRFDRFKVARAVMKRQKEFRHLNVHASEEYEKNGEDHNNDHHHHHHHDHNQGDIPWYCAPVQRQRWGDDQVLPHVNWGDLFFDLFYVAAAYNLGVLLISSMNSEDWPRGVVYFIGIFGPLYGTWESDLYYSSRYTVVDHFHRIFDVLRFLVVASVVLHIKTLELLSDSSSFETFALMVSLCLESLMQLVLNFELMWYAQGDRKAIYNHTMRKIKFQYIPISIVYMAAAILAGVLYFRANESQAGFGRALFDVDENDRFLAGGDSSGSTYDNGSSGWSISDAPYLMSMSGHILGVSVTAGRKFLLSNDQSLDVREHFVPNNIDYLIHRYGEWTMLIIGESILSLLIVETIESEDYYIIALVGVLTVILLQTVKFESEPDHPEGHALLQSMRAATSFSILIEILSMGLIAFGVSFKVMLTIAQTASGLENAAENCDSLPIDDDGHRTLAGAAIDCGDDYHRTLAAVPSITDTAASRVYCWSLAIVLVSMELMLITHHGGMRGAWQTLFRQADDNKRVLNYPLLFVVITKWAVILFITTLCLWVTDPRSIASAGFLVVAAIALTRVASWGVVNKEEEIKQFISILEVKTKDAAKKVESRTKNVAKSVARKAGSMASAAVSLARQQSDSESMIDVDGLRSAISDDSFDAIVVTDKMGLVKHVNLTTLSMFGYEDISELVGQNITILVGGGESEHHNFYMENFSKSSRTATTIGLERVLYARRKDWTEFPCIVGIKELSGTPYLVGNIRNTTGIKIRNPQEELAIDPVLRLVDDTSFDCIVVTDKAGIIQHVNITTLSEFGYLFKDELIGNNIKVLVGGSHSSKHDKYVERFQKKENRQTVLGKRRVLKSRRKDGSEFPCVIAINTIPESDWLVGIIRNITGVPRRSRSLQAEDLSAQGKQNMEEFLEDSFDSIVVATEDGTILRVNQTTVENFRYANKEELVGQNVSMLVGGGEQKNHDDYLEKFKKASVSESTIGKQRLLLSRRKDGTEFPCVIGIRRSRNGANLVAFIRDVSEVSQRDEKIIEISNINRLDPVGRLVDDGSCDCIVVIDSREVINRVNKTTLSEFGYDSKEELEGSKVSMLIGSGQTPQNGGLLDKFKEASSSGKQQLVFAKRRNGSEFQGVIAMRAIPDTEFFIGYIRNVSDLSQQDQALSTQHMEILRHVDDTSFDSIIAIDARGMIQYLNVTTLSEFGYESKDELIGRNISMLVGGGHAAKHDQYLNNFHKGGKSESTIGKQRVLFSRRKDGSEFPCLIGIRRLPDTDFLLGYIRDMTGFSKQQKALEADNISKSVTSLTSLDSSQSKSRDQSGLSRFVDEFSLDSIILMGTDGVIKETNQSFLTEFGYESKEALVGSNISMLVGDGQGDKHAEYLETYRKNGKAGDSIDHKHKFVYRRRDGTEFPCLIGIKKVPERDILIAYLTNISIM